MKDEDIRLIKQEIESNRKAGECGLASNNEKFEWTKTADALEKLLNYITNLQEENEEIKNTIDFIDNKYKNAISYNEKLIGYNQDYKTRIYKAIDKIQNMIESNNGALSNPEHTIVAKHKLLKLENDDCEYLLNILQGKSDE